MIRRKHHSLIASGAVLLVLRICKQYPAMNSRYFLVSRYYGNKYYSNFIQAINYVHAHIQDIQQRNYIPMSKITTKINDLLLFHDEV